MWPCEVALLVLCRVVSVFQLGCLFFFFFLFLFEVFGADGRLQHSLAAAGEDGGGAFVFFFWFLFFFGGVAFFFFFFFFFFLRYVVSKARTWPPGSQQRRKTIVVHPSFSSFTTQALQDTRPVVFSWRGCPQRRLGGCLPAECVCVRVWNGGLATVQGHE